MVALEPLELEMTIRKEDWPSIHEEIRKALDKRVPTGVSGWNKSARWLREWSLTGTAITVIVALISVCVTLGIRVGADIREESKFRTTTEDHFKTIEKSLGDLGHASQLGRNITPPEILAPIHPLQRFAVMDQKTLTASLPQLRTEIQRAADRSTSPPDRATLQAISQKLGVVDPRMAQYWPTVGAMITYQSWLATGRKINLTAIPQLKRCATLAGPGTLRGSHIDMADGSGKFQGCVVTIDGVNLIDSTIENTIIVFRGEPTKLQNVHFVNCLFFLTLTNTPSKPAQTVARTLLASNGTATITTPPV